MNAELSDEELDFQSHVTKNYRFDSGFYSQTLEWRAGYSAAIKQLEHLIQREKEEEETQKIQDRIELICNIFFPVRRYGNKDVIGHPEKLWWWNGNSIEEWNKAYDKKYNHIGYTIKVSSYVGCNETDYFEFLLALDWFVDDELSVRIRAKEWCEEQNVKSIANAKERKLVEARIALKHAADNLAKLSTD